MFHVGSTPSAWCQMKIHPVTSTTGQDLTRAMSGTTEETVRENHHHPHHTHPHPPHNHYYHHVYGTPGDFRTTSPHFTILPSIFWIYIEDMAAHSLALSSHLFFCLPLFLHPGTAPFSIVFARPVSWSCFTPLKCFLFRTISFTIFHVTQGLL